MKNRSIIIVAFILMFAFSCQKSENHEIISPLSTSKVIIDNEYIKRLSISKNFKKLYELSIEDKESNRLKDGIMRLSNFSAHKTLLILCSNGKDRYQQKAS